MKSGRTHLMDATPVTLGQEFGGYAAQVEDGIARLARHAAAAVRAPARRHRGRYRDQRAEGLRPQGDRRGSQQRTGLPLREAKDHFAAQGARDALVETSGQLRALAVSLVKIANDLRWMGSGPRAGLGEIRLPDLQPGSSIMPGKVNPVIPEVVTQVGAQVMGNDVDDRLRGRAGQLRAQRVRARDRTRPARLDRAAHERVHGVRREVHRRHRGERRPAARSTRSRRRRSAPRSARTSATRPRPRS